MTRLLLAALIGTGLGWYIGAVTDGLVAAARETEAPEEQSELPPEAPLLCSIIKPKPGKSVSLPACMWPSQS